VSGVSIELSEAHILAEQMNKELRGKCIKSYALEDYESLQRLGFVNKDLRVFEGLVNGKVESVTSRGNVILVKLDKRVNLILAPEYGGRVTYHRRGTPVPDKFHLKIEFTDDSTLSVRLTGMGIIQALRDAELGKSYVYVRDFSDVPSPINDREFTFDRFLKLLATRKDAMKPLLVGKEAIVVGLSNSAFQDIIYRARIHPKRKASDLNAEEKRALHDSIRLVVTERIKLGGKDQFVDLYGKQGRYAPAMGPNMKGQKCHTCGTKIESLNVGGGVTYFCPKCQK
jgi:formamidopyrimidine-DNA glycosylase